MTAAQLPLPAVKPHAPVDLAVWADFAARWAELEREHVVPRRRIEPATCFLYALGAWVVAVVDGREWSAHGDNARDAADDMFRRVNA